MTVMLPVLLLGLVAVACLGAIVVLLVWNPERQTAAGAVALGMFEPSSTPAQPTIEQGADGKTRVLSQAEIKQRQMEQRMLQAGLYRKGSTSRFMFVQLILGLAPLGLAILASQLRMISMSQAFLLGSIPAIIGILGPGLWLDHKKKQRQTSVRRALPDALDVIVVCLEAGVSMSAALVKVSKELRGAYPLLASELTIVQREVQMGNAIGDALLHFSERFDLEELRSLALVVRQAEKFGASLSSALRVHAETLRTKRLQRAQELAQKASVKMLLPTVLFIFPSLFVVILGPAAFDVYRNIKSNASNQSAAKK